MIWITIYFKMFRFNFILISEMLSSAFATILIIIISFN